MTSRASIGPGISRLKVCTLTNVRPFHSVIEGRDTIQYTLSDDKASTERALRIREEFGYRSAHSTDDKAAVGLREYTR